MCCCFNRNAMDILNATCSDLFRAQPTKIFPHNIVAYFGNKIYCVLT